MSRSAVVMYNSADVPPEAKDFTQPTANDWGRKSFLSYPFVNVLGTNKPGYLTFFEIT